MKPWLLTAALICFGSQAEALILPVSGGSSSIDGTAIAPSSLDVSGRSALHGQLTVGDAVNKTSATITGALSVTSTATFTTQVNFSNALSTQAIFSGWSSYSGQKATNNGNITLGANTAFQGILDYTGTQDLRIRNAYANTAGDIFFDLWAADASATFTPLLLKGNGDIQFNSSTMTLIGGNLTLGNGLASFNNTVSTGAIFKGYGPSGSSSNNGSIVIGGNTSYQARISMDGNSTGDVFIDNTYDNTIGDIRMRVRTSGTALTPLTVIANNGGQVAFSNETSTQAYFNGWSAKGGASGNNGLIALGSPTNGFGARLDFDGNTSGDLYIDNTTDAATADIIFRTRTSGTAIEGVKMSGAGGWRLYSRTKAQLLAIATAEEGTQFYCNDCSPKKVVVSTGTSAGNFAAADGGAFQ